jgi:hypothetical protein
MASARIRLEPQTVEAIAQRVVELLQQRAVPGRELVDAGELARRMGVDRSWVYTHAIELGAVKLGGGPRPRLRFDPMDAIERIRERATGLDTHTPAARRRRFRQSSASEDPRLLPIKPSEAS